MNASRESFRSTYHNYIKEKSYSVTGHASGDANFAGQPFNMKQYKFKSNINCSGCVAKVTPLLNQNESIKSWNVETANPNKILTVETDTLAIEDIKKIIYRAGFKAEEFKI